MSSSLISAAAAHAPAPLALAWTCLSNLAQPNAFTARLTMTNVSDAELAPGWSLFFNTCRKTIAGSVQGGFVIDHINGDLFRLHAPNGPAWPAGATWQVDYQAQFWAISITDAPLGFYLVEASGAIVDLGDPDIAPFASPQQRQRGPEDRIALADAAGRYHANAALRTLAPAQVGRLTPTPLAARLTDTSATITRHTSIVFSTGLSSEAALLRALLDALPEPANAAPLPVARIVLDIGAVALPAASSTAAPHEAYRLDIGLDAITIRGASAHGVFNAIVSLRQLCEGSTVPLGSVTDAPRFAYRGMMLDVARHFADRDTVLRLLDCMALYKLNRFHFHLTDDEGWRFAVPALPELTAVGARRGVASASGEAPCLPPSFGSGAAIATSAGSGFYSDDDLIAIIRHAHARHIEVIPECNLPGHARAAIVAMRVRYARLRAAGDSDGAERYRLDDPDDASVYESVQLWHDNVMCIARPSVERFFAVVVQALVDLFAAAGVPLRTIHTGGDEVPAGAWRASPLCRARMAERGWTLAQLRSDFIARCHAVLARHGIAYAGWEETALEHGAAGVPGVSGNALAPNPRFIGAGLQVYAWNNAWGWGQEDLAYRLANAGYQVVLANAASLYFDLACAKDPHEPGYYWAGFVDLRDTFVFCPLEMTATPGPDPMGVPVPAARLAAMTRLTDAGRSRIAGLQGQLFGENAHSRARIEYLAAPRLIALAERAWAADPQWHTLSPPARAATIASAWNEFANRLGQRVLPQLDAALAYGYRLPPPGVVVRRAPGGAAVVDANLALPGLALHYTSDGSAPTRASAAFTGPLTMPAAARQLRIACFDRRGRASRIVTIDLKDAADEPA